MNNNKQEQLEMSLEGLEAVPNHAFTDITAEMFQTYLCKNADYGNSFDKSLDEDGLLVAKIRLGDKYYRFSQLINGEPEVRDESVEDTLLDMANYAIMTVMWMRAKKAELPFTVAEYLARVKAIEEHSVSEDIANVMISEIDKAMMSGLIKAYDGNADDSRPTDPTCNLKMPFGSDFYESCATDSGDVTISRAWHDQLVQSFYGNIEE